MPLFPSVRAPRNPPPAQLVELFRSETAEIEHSSPPTAARTTVLWLTACFACLIVVSLFMPMDRVVSSETGTIVTTRSTIVLQSLDPSIIRTLDVQQGERVAKGQLLATLDPTFAAADVGALKMKIASLDAEIARCQAELAKQPFAPPAITLPEAAIYGRLQQSYFDQRRMNFDAQIQDFDQQADELRATIAKYQTDQMRLAERAKIAQQIEQMRATLAASQVGSKLNLLVATDQKVEIERTLQFDNGVLVESQHKLDAILAKRNAFVQDWLGDTTKELVKARNDRDAAIEDLSKAERHQSLVRMMAPEDAVVLDMTKLSVGSVLKEGEPLMTLAPLRSPVEAEIRIDPRDIGFLRPGDPAKIKLTAFNYQQHGEASGKVRWLSEGTFNAAAEGTVGHDEQKEPKPYYLARVALTDVALHDLPPGFRLVPGMMLTADIKVGTRSVFMYMFGGLIGVDQAMREP
jgi:hemolysin D